MCTKKIADPDTKTKTPCMHPEHEPPKHQVFQPGTYEHTCPGCGRRRAFTVTRPTF